jgi:precorrin-3B C17-methyltransferase
MKSGSGHLSLVSVGPGSVDLIVPLAREALEKSDVIVGYALYLNWIQPWIAGKEHRTLPLTQERERAALAVSLAREGRRVSLVSSGDVGVYAMAPLALEMLGPEEPFDVQIIPGITAAQSCASLLGAPLGHDFATLSLSDLLCPWEWVTQRARQLARSDLAVVLYNVQSRVRQNGVYEVLDHFLAHRPPDTWCGVVRNAYREDASAEICSLEQLRRRSFDMLTTLIVGTRFTRRTGRFLFAPRGYLGWTAEVSPPREAVWIFSGTRDGNTLARRIFEDGFAVVISVASEQGKAAAAQAVPGAVVVCGGRGKDARRALFENSRPHAIVDATHPFATRISPQLRDLCAELRIPCLRFEREETRLEDELHENVIRVDSVEDAVDAALLHGKRICLTTGIKDIPAFLSHPEAASREWFARVTPAPESLEAALSAGIPRSHLCAMQGPFSEAANRALWSDWRVDCIVSKESGPAGGVPAKIEAAKALGIPLILIQRPPLHSLEVAKTPEEVLRWISALAPSLR